MIRATGGELRVLVVQEVRVEVTLEVVHPDERNAEYGGDRLRLGDADEERPDQARSDRRSDRIDIPEREVCIAKRLADSGGQCLDVGARRDLGNDAAVLAVEIDLADDHVAEDVAPALDHGRGGFVARRLDRENERVLVPVADLVLLERGLGIVQTGSGTGEVLPWKRAGSS